MPNVMRKVKCVVACTNANGTPDFYLIVITCNEQAYEEGLHYTIASEAAESQGFTPHLVYDEQDMNKKIFKAFDWKTAAACKIERIAKSRPPMAMARVSKKS